MDNCIKLNTLNCSLTSIIQRITPIEFIDNTLFIHSPLDVSNTSITIDQTTVVGSDGVLELPEGTTVGGTPLLSPHNIGGDYVLPNKTGIDGKQVLNVNYFYFYSAYTYYRNFLNGYFINNCGGYLGLPNAADPGNYPFFAPSDCVLTSLRFSIAIVDGDKDDCDVNNVRATIYTMSLSGVQTITAIVATIPGNVDLDTRAYAETTFEYPLSKGYSVGIKVNYDGSVTSTAGISLFATLGYKFQ